MISGCIRSTQSYWSISLTHSQVPFKFSFQRGTLPSPQLTARMLPAKLQDTRQMTSGNLGGVPLGAPAGLGSRYVLFHGALGESFVQLITVLSRSGEI